MPKTTPEHFNLTKEFEGYSETLYKCPADKWTIGWGRNIEDRGISKDEAELMFRNDINHAIRDLAGIFPDLHHMEYPIRTVLVDMMFNMGLPTFRTFKRFIAAAKRHDKPAMIREMKDSAWYTQVGNRSKKLIELLTSKGGTAFNIQTNVEKRDTGWYGGFGGW